MILRGGIKIGEFKTGTHTTSVWHPAFITHFWGSKILKEFSEFGRIFTEQFRQSGQFRLKSFNFSFSAISNHHNKRLIFTLSGIEEDILIFLKPISVNSICFRFIVEHTDLLNHGFCKWLERGNIQVFWQHQKNFFLLIQHWLIMFLLFLLKWFILFLLFQWNKLEFFNIQDHLPNKDSNFAFFLLCISIFYDLQIRYPGFWTERRVMVRRIEVILVQNEL